jgi:hypothetical protein
MAAIPAVWPGVARGKRLGWAPSLEASRRCERIITRKSGALHKMPAAPGTNLRVALISE